MITLGLDLSLNHIGWAVVGGRSHVSGLIKPDSAAGPSRLASIREQVQSVILNNGPDLTVIEGYAFGMKFKAHDLGEVGGVVRLLLYDLHKDFHVVPPATLKKWTAGTGKAMKEFMLLRIYKRWGMEFESIDEAEAFALAKWGQEQLEKGEPR